MISSDETTGAVGQVIFDRTSANHEEIWDDTELIRAYDQAQRQIETRLRDTSKPKRSSTSKKTDKATSVDNRQAENTLPQRIDVPMNGFPIPMPPMMISPPKDEDDALQSMLMAWYMAGYHAGRLAAQNQKKTQ
jgi:hypothetical protein